MSAKMDPERSIYGASAGNFVIRPPTASVAATLLLLFAFVAVMSLQIATRTPFPWWTTVSDDWKLEVSTSSEDPRSCGRFFEGGAARRKVVMSIREFGGVGDGKTSETETFQRAIRHLRRFGEHGGSQLNVPRGRWLTGSFNLTSNFTLFLEDGAVILGSQDPKEWPVIEPLPSYGRGRERLGGRHISLIHGDGLTNVVITGQNGTIDGQGSMWWELWWNRTLNYTRGHLLELMNSHNILISNLTFLNSPFWTVHPVYCRSFTPLLWSTSVSPNPVSVGFSNVVIKNMTILAPLNAPNTDGIDPDSSTNVCIEDCYIESGDDLVAVKSGWDHYGIKMARPSSNIIVRKVSGTTPTCSGVGIGSEMSGGISNVTIEDMHIWDSAAGVRIKSDIGRGGYVANISISNVKMERVKIPIRFSRGSNDHPDDGWDRNAVPKVKGISISNVLSLNSTKAPELKGIEGTSFEEICFKNVTVLGLGQSAAWHCELISGYANGVSPTPCPELRKGGSSLWCP